MTDGPRSPHALPPRSKAASLFMAVPIAFAAVLMIAGIAVFVLGQVGGRAAGERVTVRYAVACDPPSSGALTEAEVATGRLVDARAMEIGLGQPHISQEAGSLVITATMPGLPDDRAAVPALLARPGALEIRHQGSVLATRTDLVQARMRLDKAGMPTTDLVLVGSAARRLAEAAEGDPEGSMDIVLDGEVVGQRPNSIGLEDDTIALPAGDGMTREQMRRVADRGIVLNHGPLPCALHLESVETAASP